MFDSPYIYFSLFVIFILCQYAIWICSNVVAHWFHLTGKVYWAMVLVAFLIINNWCFGAYDFGLNDELEEFTDEWQGDE